MVFYGVGNHGGGPTRANLDSIERLNAADGGPAPRAAPRCGASSTRAADDELPAYARRAPASRRRLLLGALGDQALEPPGREPAAARGEVGGRRRRAGRGQPYPLSQLTRGLEAPALQPVPRHARGHVDRAGVRGRARPARPRELGRGARAQPRGAVGRPPDRHPARARGRSRSSSSTRTRGRCARDVELEFAGFPNDGPHGSSTSDGRAGAPCSGRAPRDRERLARRRRLPRRAAAARLPRLPACTGRRRPSPVARSTRERAPAARARPGDRADRAAGPEGDRRRTSPPRSARHAVVVDDRSDTWGHRVRAYADVVGEFECTSVRRRRERAGAAIVRVESRYGASTLVEEYVLAAGARLRRRARHARLARAAASC